MYPLAARSATLPNAFFTSGSLNFALPARRSCIQLGFLAYTSVPKTPATSGPIESCTPPVTNGVMPLALSFSESAITSAYVVGGELMPAWVNRSLL